MTNARILVVDDEPQIRRVMRTTLVARGYMVSTARNGEEALDKVREERFDLVLLDINMPGIGGMEACRIIRSQSDIPIVILSIRNAEKEKVEALDAGADDYVTKPFSMPELLGAHSRRPSPGPLDEFGHRGRAERWVQPKSISPPAALPWTARSAFDSQGIRPASLLRRQSRHGDSAHQTSSGRVGAGLWRRGQR